MIQAREVTGGCFCGKLRYQVTCHPTEIVYCHCRMCQRSSGAPVLAWASFPIESFTYTTGAPTILQSSVAAQREFCQHCGTQLVFRELSQTETVDVTVASLDQPTLLQPEYHIWTESQIDWFETADNLPRYGDAGRDRHSE